ALHEKHFDLLALEALPVERASRLSERTGARKRAQRHRPGARLQEPPAHAVDGGEMRSVVVHGSLRGRPTPSDERRGVPAIVYGSPKMVKRAGCLAGIRRCCVVGWA